MLRAGGGVSVIMVVLSYTVLALRQRSIYIPSTGYVSDYHVIQQAQQATVTGMGLGDDGVVVDSSQAERLPQQGHDVLLLAGLDDFGRRL